MSEVSKAYFSPQGGIFTIEILAFVGVAGYIYYRIKKEGDDATTFVNDVEQGLTNLGNGAIGLWNQWTYQLSNYFDDLFTPSGGWTPGLQYMFDNYQGPVGSGYTGLSSIDIPVYQPNTTSLLGGLGEFAGGGVSITGNDNIGEVTYNPEVQSALDTASQQLNNAFGTPTTSNGNSSNNGTSSSVATTFTNTVNNATSSNNVSVSTTDVLSQLGVNYNPNQGIINQQNQALAENNMTYLRIIQNQGVNDYKQRVNNEYLTSNFNNEYSLHHINSFY